MSVQAELEKLIALLAGSIFQGCFHPPAKAEDFAVLETKTGVSVGGGLKKLWSIANGAEDRQYGTPVFGVDTFGLAPCVFLSIEQAIGTWCELQEWDEFEDYEPRDSRIQPGRINPKWLPFAQFNMNATILFFDAAPSLSGAYGQIISFTHDPAGIHFLATTFEEFFKNSNALLRDSELNDWIRGT
jgi:cell wall assembly regulator SMI1